MNYLLINRGYKINNENNREANLTFCFIWLFFGTRDLLINRNTKTYSV